MPKNIDFQRNDTLKYGKLVKQDRIAPSKLKELLAAADLSMDDFAIMWGTTPNRVSAWCDGRDDIPFPVSWALALLGRPSNFDAARLIVEQHSAVKPQYRQYGLTHKKINALKDAISEHFAGLTPALAAWKKENPDEIHRSIPLIERFEKVSKAQGVMNIIRQLKELEAISNLIGLGIDVNQEILKQNAPFIEKIDADRRARAAEERAILSHPTTAQIRQHYEKQGLEVGDQDGRIAVREPRGDWRDAGVVSDYRISGGIVRRLKSSK